LTRLRWWAAALIIVPSMPVVHTLRKPTATDEEILGAIGFWVLCAIAGNMLIIVDFLRGKRSGSRPKEPEEDA
jgi:hypothetical protein